MTTAELQHEDATVLGQRSAEEPRHGKGIRPALTRVGIQVALAVAFVIVSVMLRGQFFGSGYHLNPDEAEMMGQARAALRNPVPFTTWTTATTGPIWVLFLVLVHGLGLPLTMPAAHLLSAVLVGVMGYLGFTLARRVLDNFFSFMVTMFWWLPFVLSLVGDPVNFAALSTELLPCVLILCACLMRPEKLAANPKLFAIPGVLSGLALGAKYQALPLVLAVLAVQLGQPSAFQWRQALPRLGWWLAGGVAPAVILAAAMIVSPDASWTAVWQNLVFMSDYSGLLGFNGRLGSLRTAVTTMHLVLLVLLVCWLGSRSAPRVQFWRAVLVVGGVLAVYMGGLGFEHYRIFLYTALTAAIALPLKPAAQLVPFTNRPRYREAVAVIVFIVAWAAAFGVPTQLPPRTQGSQLAQVTAAEHPATQDPVLAAACPKGSEVMVWGWAPEMYTFYSWKNAIPYMNTTLLTWVADNKESGYPVIRDAVQRPSTACVVDAVGLPFFDMDETSSLTRIYPDLATTLSAQYRSIGSVHACEHCTVYVRN